MQHFAAAFGKQSPQFTGHETFPLRYGWLKKSHDAVVSYYQNEPSGDAKAVFLRPDAIAEFGVGKNMVQAIRHWSVATGMLSEDPEKKHLIPSSFGNFLMGDRSFDLFLQKHDSLWLIHWNLVSNPARVTWHWAFNYFSRQSFEREYLVRSLASLSTENEWKGASLATLKRDVECFLRTYASRPTTKRMSPEDAIECPLAELSLIKQLGRRDSFRFVDGDQNTLSSGVFTYALIDFWQRYHPSSSTLSFERILHDPGSPGRIFRLSEAAIADRLEEIELVSGGLIGETQTSGLKQAVCYDMDLIASPWSEVEKVSFLEAILDE